MTPGIGQALVEAALALNASGINAGTSGNVSARIDGGLLITPSGMAYDVMQRVDLVEVSMGGHWAAGRRPSSEWRIHRDIYEAFPDAQAIVHAHPPVTNAFSFAGVSLADPVIPEVVVAFGTIPTTEYATPSSEEGPMVIRGLIRNHDVIILQRHGSLTVGATLSEAYHKLEKLEHAAQTLLAARQLGQVRELSRDELDRLATVAEKLGYGRLDIPPRPD